VGFVRRHPVLATLLGVAAMALGVLALTGVAVWRAAHTDDARRVDHTDLIVVLGAAQYGGDPSPAFEGRLRHAAILYEQGRASTVLVVGGGQPGDETTEAEAGRDYLVAERGLPEDAVLALPEGSTTLESLEAAERFMSARELHSAFLVSDPWHNLRIKRMAGDLGIEGYASATWQSAFRTESSRLSGYARETFAYLYYRVFGR
jgi:vancomycin permeability regulator SanA